MNLEEHVLDVLVVPPFQVKEALRCLLHTILFNRALGPVRPREMDSELFALSYVRCGVAAVDKSVEEAIEKFSNQLRLNRDTSRGRIVLSFYNRRIKKTFFGMSSTEEKVYWEKWVIPVVASSKSSSDYNRKPSGSDIRRERDKRQRQTEEALRDSMLSIISRVNKKRQHLPPVNLNTSETMLFPYEISIPQNSEVSESWITRMLQTGPPLLT